uniref:(northern house mosquito) hypothetical protein n=1 Tax=Culex pipiens TaxID=7175 RepID=A0A8D8BZA8_CULPI
MAGGRHADLLLAGAGLRRTDRVQLVQSGQQQLLPGRAGRLLHELQHQHVRRRGGLFRDRIQGPLDLRLVRGGADRADGAEQDGRSRPSRLRSPEGTRKQCLRNRPGVHHLHRGDQPVSGGPAVGRPVLPDAVHARHRFAVWNARGRHHLAGGHEALSECAQGGHHGGSLSVV